MTPQLTAALELAAKGIPVFPLTYAVDRDQPEDGRVRWGLADCSCLRFGCPTPGAHPVYGEAPAGSVCVQTILGWWRHHPRANVGVQTGQTFDVLETDPGMGEAMLAMLDLAGTPRPPISTAPDGCWQWWIAGPLGLPSCQVAFGPESPLRIRIVGVGGFLAAPPSRFPSGHQVDWLYRFHSSLPSATTVTQALLDAHSRASRYRQLGPPTPTTQPVPPSPRRAASSLVPAGVPA